MNTKKPTNQAFQPTKKPRTNLRVSPAPKTSAASPSGSHEQGADGERATSATGAAALVFASAGVSENAAAFARVEAEIAAVPLESVRTINVHVPSAVVLVLGKLPRLLALRDEMIRACPRQPLETIDKLRDYALAAAHAYARVLPRDGGETRLRTLLNEASPLRERMLASAGALVAFGLLDAEAVAVIRRGTGHLDTIQDLLSLGELLRQAGPEVVSKTPLVPADIERAIQLGELLLEALGQQREGTDGSNDRGEAEEQLAKAFELFRRAYEEYRRTINHIRWYEGDADEIAPSLAQSRRQGRRPQVDEPVIEPGDAESP
jgi:hypothetical protein